MHFCLSDILDFPVISDYQAFILSQVYRWIAVHMLKKAH